MYIMKNFKKSFTIFYKWTEYSHIDDRFQFHYLQLIFHYPENKIKLIERVQWIIQWKKKLQKINIKQIH